MNDLITRQDAIDAINEAFKHVFAWDGTSPLGEKVLKNVPSAQPEIIRCKECLWRVGRDCTRFTDLPVCMDDYCGRAKMRGEQE